MGNGASVPSSSSSSLSSSLLNCSLIIGGVGWEQSQGRPHILQLSMRTMIRGRIEPGSGCLTTRRLSAGPLFLADGFVPNYTSFIHPRRGEEKGRGGGGGGDGREEMFNSFVDKVRRHGCFCFLLVLYCQRVYCFARVVAARPFLVCPALLDRNICWCSL